MSASEARKRGPYAKSARIHDEVIAAATQAFSERGFGAVSMREIAIAVGMTQQGLSHHFPSKEAVLQAVLQRRDETSLRHYRGLGLSTVDTLRAVVADNLERRGLVQLSAILGAEATNPDHPAHEFFKAHQEGARQAFEVLLARGQTEGDIRSDIPAPALAVLVVGIFEGLQLQWLTTPDFDLAAAFETAFQVLEPA